MSTALRDTIEREMVLKAPIERVYGALSTTEGICGWFTHSLEGSVDSGEDVVFVWKGSESTFRVSVHFVALNPVHYVAYRWVPGSESGECDVLATANTLVEFHLEPIEEGTKLRMVESGFASLPAHYCEQAFKENNSGWDEELPKLKAFVEKE